MTGGAALGALMARTDTAAWEQIRRAVRNPEVYGARVDLVGDFVRVRVYERLGVLQGRKLRGSAGGRRGCIVGFSGQSRERLFREMARLDPGLPLPMFVTLTLPGGYGLLSGTGRWSGEREFIGEAASPPAMAAAFERFRERLRYSHSDLFGLWRAEWQKRVAQHWHLAIFGWEGDGRALREMQGWVSRAWYEAVGSGDPRHLAAGTQWKSARVARGMWSYLGKELGKSHQAGAAAMAERFGTTGRPWGYVNKALVQAHQREVETVAITPLELVEVLHVLGRESGRPGVHWRAATDVAWIGRVLLAAQQEEFMVRPEERQAA